MPNLPKEKNRYIQQRNGLYPRIVSPPKTLNDEGKEGNVAFDDQYFYTYYKGIWHRTAISQFQ
jgi:hypothetical protein